MYIKFDKERLEKASDVISEKLITRGRCVFEYTDFDVLLVNYKELYFNTYGI